MSRGTSWRSAIADIGRTATSRGRTALGRYLIEGVRLHERALRAGVSVETVLVSESVRESAQRRLGRLLSELDRAGSRILYAPDPALERVTEGRTPAAGLVGLVRFPEPPGLSRQLSPTARLLIGCDVEEPGNVGALVRTALASGAAAFVSVGCTDPYHPKAVRTSMGSLFKLPLLYRADAETLVDELAELGVATVGAVSNAGTPLDRMVFDPGAIGVFVGSESRGLPPEVISRLETLITVPMASAVDSFSVNAAAAIALYEIARQSRRR